MKLVSYNLFEKSFKNDAVKLLEEHLPGKLHLLRQDLNSFLKKEKNQFRRWHAGLLFGLISSTEFTKLFNGIRNSFALKKLKLAGLSAEELIQLVTLLRKLFRAMMVSTTQD